MKTYSTFDVVKVSKNFVYLVDLDIGRSVTNDADNVCKHINYLYPNKRIVYKDTQGEWTELCHVDGKFTVYAPFDITWENEF